MLRPLGSLLNWTGPGDNLIKFLFVVFHSLVYNTMANPTIINGTSHQIKFYSQEDTIPVQGGRKLVLKEGAQPILVIEPGVNLNAQKGNKEAPSISCGIHLKGAVIFVGHDPIPEGDVVIVSNMFRSAVVELGGNTSSLATVDGTVYESEESLRPCGCLALAVG